MRIINREISRKAILTNRSKGEICTRKGLKKSFLRKTFKIIAVLKTEIHKPAVSYKSLCTKSLIVIRIL